MFNDHVTGQVFGLFRGIRGWSRIGGCGFRRCLVVRGMAADKIHLRKVLERVRLWWTRAQEKPYSRTTGRPSRRRSLPRLIGTQPSKSTNFKTFLFYFILLLYQTSAIKIQTLMTMYRYVPLPIQDLQDKVQNPNLHLQYRKNKINIEFKQTDHLKALCFKTSISYPDAENPIA